MKHILIVDDDVEVTNFFEVFIAQTGLFETTIVNDPRKVMALFAKEQFDIVLLDLDMPDVSGMEILQDMNQQAINVPVVVLTGVNDVDLAVKSMKLGVFDYLVKDAGGFPGGAGRAEGGVLGGIIAEGWRSSQAPDPAL